MPARAMLFIHKTDVIKFVILYDTFSLNNEVNSITGNTDPEHLALFCLFKYLFTCDSFNDVFSSS
jgi:hypothetical protein